MIHISEAGVAPHCKATQSLQGRTPTKQSTLPSFRRRPESRTLIDRRVSLAVTASHRHCKATRSLREGNADEAIQNHSVKPFKPGLKHQHREGHGESKQRTSGQRWPQNSPLLCHWKTAKNQLNHTYFRPEAYYYKSEKRADSASYCSANFTGLPLASCSKFLNFQRIPGRLWR